MRNLVHVSAEIGTSHGGSLEKAYQLIDAAAEAGAVVFHAGTAFKDGQIVTAGGRVLGVSALGETIQEAIDNAYKAVAEITWDDVFYRKDIAQKAIRRQNGK
jgi:phosphoribosylamine--glycine ligase